MPKKTKRKFTRIRFKRRVNVDFFTDRYNECHIKDLSLTGMFVFGSFEQHVGELCAVNLVQQGETSALTLQATARVVRINNDGVAIEFTSMTFDSYMFLQVTLLYEVQDPLVIGLELPENCPFEIIEHQPIPIEKKLPSQAV